MKHGLRICLFIAIALGGGGCAMFGIETGHRSFTIKNHQFEPAQINVPKGSHFFLTINAIDDRDPVISAPELGFSRLRVPSVPKYARPNPSKYARLPLGPLNAGRYTILCECHGNPATANILVE